MILLRRRILRVRRPFYQRDRAQEQRDQPNFERHRAMAERDQLIAERGARVMDGFVNMDICPLDERAIRWKLLDVWPEELDQRVGPPICQL